MSDYVKHVYFVLMCVCVSLFLADRMTSEQQQSGRLIIQADDKVTHQLEVTFEATVLQG